MLREQSAWGRFVRSLLFAGAVGVVWAAPASAQQTWSANGSTAGGSGTWTGVSTNWLPGPAAWSSTQTGVFSGVSGTITLPTTLNVSSGLRFDADGFRITFSSVGDLGNNFVFANALNLQGTPTMQVGSGAVGTIATLLTGAGSLTKTGQGALNLVNPFSTYTGNIVVNEGTLIAGANGVPAAAGAALYTYHNGNNSALGQISGGAVTSRQVVVNAGATLNFIGDDTFGDRTAAITPVRLVANGGLITNGPVVNNNGTPVNTGFQGAFNPLGPVQLDGGTLRSTWGKFKPTGADADYPGFQAFAFRSTVTSNGNSTIDSQLNQVPAFGGFHLGAALADANPIFNVASGTLTVSAVLLDKPSSMPSEAGGSRNNIRSGLTKSGPGTMILSGTNEYTGNTTLTDGTLRLAENGVLRFAVNTSTGNFNSIGGSSGILDLDGTLFFDLANASTVPGTTWGIVNGASIDEFYNPTFAVSSSLGSFTGIGGGVWSLTSGTNTWRFEQSGGTLSVVPEPSTWAMAVGAIVAGGVAARRRTRRTGRG